MSDKNKKTLTLGTSKLGVKKDAPLGSKLGVSSSYSGKSFSPGKGKVVVVTKSVRGAKPTSSNFGSADNKLTESEKLKRLEVLKKAEEARKKQEEIQKAIAAQRISDSDEESKNEVSDQNDANEREEQQQESISINEPEKKLRSASDLESILNNKKIRNLDSIGRKSEPESKNDESLDAIPAKVSLQENHFSKEKKYHNVHAEKTSNEEKAAPAPAKKYEDKRASKKISVSEVMTLDSEEGGYTGGIRRRSLASIRRAKDKARRKFEQSNTEKPQEKIVREVLIPDFITVQELANRMAERAAALIKSLMNLGIMVTVNQTVDADTAELVATEFGHKVKRVTDDVIETELLQKITDNPELMKSRAPVVTIMGHVDHGKTSLLDSLRQTDVVSGEAGGITQHIGAYQITLANGKEISFLDTPGHEAFTAMRMRGAKVTDIVVLVVSADDGIMPQTVEAISHAKAAEVPIIVAINKIDKPDANPEKVKQSLLSYGLIPEDMGGDNIIVEVSAKQKINLDKLEDAILLQAEFLDLKADPNRVAEGAVVESKVDKGRGVVATLLVQKGTLNSGDIIVAGTAYGKIRALINDKGKKLKTAGPSMPIEVLGLNSAPTAGDDFLVVRDEKIAKEVVSMREIREKQKLQTKVKNGMSLDKLFSKSGIKELSIIVKADVQGSVEAICQSVEKLSTDEITVRTIHSAVGGITESDVTLASASNSIIIGFNVRANSQARDIAKINAVDIRYYSIIYNLVDEIKAAMSGMLSPDLKEKITGYADVRQVFNLSKFGKVAGCMVTEGMIKRGTNARILRDSVVIFDGKLKALKRFKEDIKEVSTGFECGLSFENYEDIKVGDRIEAYEITEEQRTL